ncbi:MAG: hypothetical protein AB7H90_11580 [Alphaproteobacteria bacterium]
MLEITAAAAGIAALKNIIDIVDKVGDKWLRYKETGLLTNTAPQQHSMQIVVAADQSQITAHFGSAPLKTVTRDELANMLSADDLRHLEAIEERMRLIAERWDNQTKIIELEINERTKFIYEQQLRRDEKSLASVLVQALNFIQRCNFILDDHYHRMHDIAARTAAS